jgi:hypothetical protein
MIENLFNKFYCNINEIIDKINQLPDIQFSTINTNTNYILSKLKDFEIYKTISNFNIFKIILKKKLNETFKNFKYFNPLIVNLSLICNNQYCRIINNYTDKSTLKKIQQEFNQLKIDFKNLNNINDILKYHNDVCNNLVNICQYTENDNSLLIDNIDSYEYLNNLYKDIFDYITNYNKDPIITNILFDGDIYISSKNIKINLYSTYKKYNYNDNIQYFISDIYSDIDNISNIIFEINKELSDNINAKELEKCINKINYNINFNIKVPECEDNDISNETQLANIYNIYIYLCNLNDIMSKKNITGIANIITNSHLNIKNIKNINKLQQTLKNLFEEEIISDHGINFINDSIENIIYIDDMFKIFDPNADYIDDMYITPIIDNNFQDIYMFYIVNLIYRYICYDLRITNKFKLNDYQKPYFNNSIYNDFLTVNNENIMLLLYPTLKNTMFVNANKNNLLQIHFYNVNKRISIQDKNSMLSLFYYKYSTSYSRLFLMNEYIDEYYTKIKYCLLNNTYVVDKYRYDIQNNITKILELVCMSKTNLIKKILEFVYINNEKDYLIDKLNNDRYNFILSQINKYIISES